MNFKSLSFGAVILLSGCATFCPADLEFQLSPISPVTVAGATIGFTATLYNDGTDPIYINGDSVPSLDSALTLDDTPFWSGSIPYPLNGGQSWLGPIFNITVDPSATPGTYYGDFAILGGGPSDYGQIADSPFSVQVQAVPEPGPWVGLGAAVLLVRRRRT